MAPSKTLRRLIPKPGVTGKSIAKVAWDEGWDIEGMYDADPQKGTMDEKVYSTADGTLVRFVEDRYLKLQLLVVEGDLEGVEEAEAALLELLPIYTPDELVAQARDADGSSRAHAAIRLGVLAMSAPAKKVMAALERLMSDPDPRVRQGALHAVSYCEHPAFRHLVEHLAESDHDPQVRDMATALREAYVLRDQKKT